MARVGPSEPSGSDLRLNAWLLPLQQEISSVRREKETLKSEKETLKSEKETLKEESETLKQRKLQLLKQRLQLLKQRSQLLRQKIKNNEPIDLESRDIYPFRLLDLSFDNEVLARYLGVGAAHFVIASLDPAGMVDRAYGGPGFLSD
jgi:hypothetical protein